MSVAQPVPRAAALEPRLGRWSRASSRSGPSPRGLRACSCSSTLRCADQTLRNGLLRAMQQGYFGSDGYSQTRAVREAALAAHYVLRHHNRDVLPHGPDQRRLGRRRRARRRRFRGARRPRRRVRLARRRAHRPARHPAAVPSAGPRTGPAITLWRTPLRPGDRLALVCGATWRPDSQRTIETILSEATSTAVAEERLAEALSDARARRHPGRGARVAQPARAAPAAAARAASSAVSAAAVTSTPPPPPPRAAAPTLVAGALDRARCSDWSCWP